MWSFKLLVLLLMFFRPTKQNERKDCNVLLLTKQNFTKVVNENEFVLVNFYAPWCGHCRALEPEFLGAAKKLANLNSKVKLAKVDATIEEDLAYEQQVRSYPTLRFFRDNESMAYTGGRLAADIFDWVLKQLEPPVKQLNDLKELNQFIGQHKIAVLGFFKEHTSIEANIFRELAKQMKDYHFGVSNDEEVYVRLGAAENDVLIFKPHDEGRAYYEGDFQLDKIKKFIQLESLPVIMEFDQESASKILRGPTNSFLLFFISKEGNQFGEIVEPLRELAKLYREYALFVTVTHDGADKNRAFEYFSIKKEDTPTMRLITLDEKDELIKYKPDTKEISIKTVDDFLQRYLEGFLKRHYLSQNLPDDWDDSNLKVLVASNFFDVVQDVHTVTLVEFYAPWCGHCKQLEPILNQLADWFKDDYSIVIAKINGVANEIEDLKVTTFPTIKLFRRGDNKMIDFDRARTFDELAEFVETNGGGAGSEGHEFDNADGDGSYDAEGAYEESDYFEHDGHLEL